MKLLLDPQMYNEQKYGGISRYHTEVYLELKKIIGVDIKCPIVYSDNLHLKEHRLFRSWWNQFLTSKLFNRKVRAARWKKIKEKNLQKCRQALKKQDFDVFISSYYNPYFLQDLGDKPFVLTLHDMIHEIFPHYYPNDTAVAEQKRQLLFKAAKIIAVSQNTKKDILRFYPELPPSKIEVVYLSQSIKTCGPNVTGLPKNYILFVGNRTIYKNFTFFIEAISPILNSDPDLYVVCAGGNRFERDEKKLLMGLGISSQVMQQNFDDNELESFYSQAKCFVFPSPYEGFGIPVLEAMACGCPVILTNQSSFPEIAGDAGIFFEPDDADDLRDKLSALLADTKLQREFSSRGMEQAKKYSWKKTAENCLKVYRDAI